MKKHLEVVEVVEIINYDFVHSIKEGTLEAIHQFNYLRKQSRNLLIYNLNHN